jgi:hypothetical protein
MLLTSGVAVAVACHVTRAQVTPAPDDPCVLQRGSVGDTLTIGLAGGARPQRDPLVRSDAERLIGRHLYEALIDVDCEGRLHPALAESWHTSTDGTSWIFRLREGASFADGNRVTAPHIEATWSLSSRDRERSAVTSVVAAGDRELRIATIQGLSTSPSLFADQRYVVRADRGDAVWPLGTRGYVVESSTGSEVSLTPAGGMRGDQLPVIRVAFGPRDPRDWIDARLDVVIVRAPSAIEYAESVGEYALLPLPWTRVYGLVTGSDTPSVERWTDVSTLLSTGLASTGMRAPTDTYWWETSPACATPVNEGGRTPNRSERIVYVMDDDAARGLAERLVAVMSSVSPSDGARRTVAVGLDETAFATALSGGTDGGYIVDLPTDVLDSCSATSALGRRVPWMDPARFRTAIIPLAETRATAIVREGVGPLRVDREGTLHFPTATSR